MRIVLHKRYLAELGNIYYGARAENCLNCVINFDIHQPLQYATLRLLRSALSVSWSVDHVNDEHKISRMNGGISYYIRT